MKIKYVILGSLCWAISLAANATAQLNLLGSQSGSKVVTTNVLSSQERQELQRLRQEKQISDRVQIEVDRAFDRPFNSILIWLILLTLLPINTAICVWLSRRILISEIISNSPQFELKKENPVQIDKAPADEINQKINIIEQKIEYCLQEIQTLTLEIREERDKHFQEISAINSYYSTENAVSENQMNEADRRENILQSFSGVEPNREVTATANGTSEYVIESQVSPEDSSTESLTAIDYLNQGNQHFSAGRYAEANISFNQAVQLDRDFSEARYQNAKAYAMRGSVNPAIGNLQWAIDIDVSYKERANNDSAFDPIREDENFKKLIDS